MLAWDKNKSSKSRRPNYHFRSRNADGGEVPQKSNQKHLPGIHNQNHYGFEDKDANNYSRQEYSNEMDHGDFYEEEEIQQPLVTPNKKRRDYQEDEREYVNTTKKDLDTFHMTNDDKFRSASPFSRKTLHPKSPNSQIVQHHYAKVLEEQIKTKSNKKRSEKIKEMELEKKLINDGEFYKYFGQDNYWKRYGNRHGFENNLTHDQSSREIDDPFPPSAKKKDMHEFNETKSIHRTPNIPKIRDEDEQNSFEISDNRVSQSFNHGYEKPSHPNRTTTIKRRILAKKLKPLDGGVFYDTEKMPEEYLNENLKAYLQKMEYKKTLEAQILEKNLRKKHEEEVKLLEERIEELQITQERLKERVNSNSPTAVASNNLAEAEIHRIRGEIAKGSGKKKSIQPPSEVKNTTSNHAFKIAQNSKKNLTALSDLPAANIPTEEIQPMANDFPSFNQSFNNQYIPPANNLHVIEFQTELNRIRDEIRDNANRMNQQIIDFKNELLSDRSNRFKNDEELKSHLVKLIETRANIQKEIIRENPTIVKTPYSHVQEKIHPPTIMGYSDSKASLVHDSQFLPLQNSSLSSSLGKNHSKIKTEEKPILNGMGSIDESKEFGKRLDTSFSKFQSNRDSVQVKPIETLKSKNYLKESNYSLSKLNLTNNMSVNPAISSELFSRHKSGIAANEFPSINSNGSLNANALYFGKKNNEYGPLMNNLVEIANKLEKSVNNQHQRINKDLNDIHKELSVMKTKGDTYPDPYQKSPSNYKNSDYMGQRSPSKGESLGLSPSKLVDIIPKTDYSSHTLNHRGDVIPKKSSSTNIFNKAQLQNEKFDMSFDNKSKPSLHTHNFHTNNHSDSHIPHISSNDGPLETNTSYMDPKSFIKEKEMTPSSFGKLKKKCKDVHIKNKGTKRKREEHMPEYVQSNSNSK